MGRENIKQNLNYLVNIGFMNPQECIAKSWFTGKLWDMYLRKKPPPQPVLSAWSYQVSWYTTYKNTITTFKYKGNQHLVNLFFNHKYQSRVFWY